MAWFSTWTSIEWLMLAMVLGILELVVPGVFLMWWGLAAIVVAGIIFLFPNLPFVGVIYAILALLFTFAWYKYQPKKAAISSPPELNQGLHAMVGLKGVVNERTKTGLRGKFRDTTWMISGEDLAVGDVIEVVSVDGQVLNVKKCEA